MVYIPSKIVGERRCTECGATVALRKGSKYVFWRCDLEMDDKGCKTETRYGPRKSKQILLEIASQKEAAEQAQMPEPKAEQTVNKEDEEQNNDSEDEQAEETGTAGTAEPAGKPEPIRREPTRRRGVFGRNRADT